MLVYWSEASGSFQSLTDFFFECIPYICLLRQSYEQNFSKQQRPLLFDKCHIICVADPINAC